MAEFCKGCTADEGLPGNDFAGWLGGQRGAGWSLCEGCGVHLFTDEGARWCKGPAAPVVGACGSCEEGAHSWAAYVVEPQRPVLRCCNCNARLGFALSAELTAVGPTWAPAVLLPDGRAACSLCVWPF